MEMLINVRELHAFQEMEDVRLINHSSSAKQKGTDSRRGRLKKLRPANQEDATLEELSAKCCKRMFVKTRPEILDFRLKKSHLLQV